jgi:AraC-like DNA-binding protein
MEQKQLYRKVKQLTGYSPIAYMKQLRMKKAAVLLREKQFTVSEVMYMVGYTNASYFTRCFSEEFGITPKQYREQIDH